VLQHIDCRMFKKTLLLFIAIFTLLSCDPVHRLTLENRSNMTINVIYSPELDDSFMKDKKAIELDIYGQKMYQVSIDSTESIEIGSVVARYTPRASDVWLDYLEIRRGQDTLRLTGRGEILSTIQEVGKLDWRLIIE